ncbi:MAG: hypothetical protein ILA52_00645, partial [Alphaproteobacteria bacterium]|nr:hypothetical protein [Alphaproteobacteria bacterium]
DEDDEDDYEIDPLLSLQQLQINHNDASNGDNSLINALNEQERRQIMQSTNIEIKSREENAGKQDALEKTNTLLRKATLPKMNSQEFAKEMNTAIYNPRQLRRETLERNIAKRMGIKGKITEKHEGNVVRGVKKLKTMTNNKQTPNLNMEDVQKIGRGKMTDNQTAELVLKKSGQTARLSELKRQVKQPQNKGKSPNTSNKSYSKQMKEILRETLKKNDKVH